MDECTSLHPWSVGLSRNKTTLEYIISNIYDYVILYSIFFVILSINNSLYCDVLTKKYRNVCIYNLSTLIGSYYDEFYITKLLLFYICSKLRVILNILILIFFRFIFFLNCSCLIFKTWMNYAYP